MRYSTIEHTTLLGELTPGSQVTISVLDLSTDRIINVGSNECIESSNVPGLYMWSTNNIIDQSVMGKFKDFHYVMSDMFDLKFSGKFVLGGYVDKDVVTDLTAANFNPGEIHKILKIINARI